MKLKTGVLLINVKPQTTHAMSIADMLHMFLFAKDLTVTSISDGKHGANSLHYKGLAFDCRISDKTATQTKLFATQLKTALGPDYDVVLESDHIHVEFDPK